MRTGTNGRARNAFTLVELLVVLVIIAVLMTIGLVIGARARAGARASATQNTIQILDNALTAMMSVNNEMPKPLISLPADARIPNSPPSIRQVMSDNMPPGSIDPRESSCAWFVYQASQSQEAKTVLEAINPKFIVTYDGNQIPEAPGLRVIKDAFGFPIRYVHPTLHGLYATRDPITTFGTAPTGTSYRLISSLTRTSVGSIPPPPPAWNSDGGQCSGNRPYFYSVGEDGLPATREDNIYAENGKPAFIDGP